MHFQTFPFLPFLFQYHWAVSFPKVSPGFIFNILITSFPSFYDSTGLMDMDVVNIPTYLRKDKFFSYRRNPLMSLIRDRITLVLMEVTPESWSMVSLRKLSNSFWSAATAWT